MAKGPHEMNGLTQLRICAYQAEMAVTVRAYKKERTKVWLTPRKKN